MSPPERLTAFLSGIVLVPQGRYSAGMAAGMPETSFPWRSAPNGQPSRHTQNGNVIVPFTIVELLSF